MADTRTPSPMERLPGEIKLAIFELLPDFESVRSLILTSRSMYALFRERRSAVARKVLAKVLDGLSIDALALEVCNERRLTLPRSVPDITRFLDQYESFIDQNSLPADFRRAKDEDLFWLVRFHQGVIKPLGKQYAACALPKVAANPIWDSELGDGIDPRAETTEGGEVVLSRSEEVRIWKALYRFEIFRLLFLGDPSKTVEPENYEQLLAVKNIYPSIFEPWEAEAIWCVGYHFLRYRYLEFAHRAYSPTWNGNALEGMRDEAGHEFPSYGLEAALRVFTSPDPSTLLLDMHSRMVTMKESLGDPGFEIGELFDEVFSPEEQVQRRGFRYTPRDHAEECAHRIMYVGDAPDAPPLGWVLTWSNRYANIYGKYLPHSYGQWGYVFWDQARLVAMGGHEICKHMWQNTFAEPEGRHLVQLILSNFGWSPLEPWDHVEYESDQDMEDVEEDLDDNVDAQMVGEATDVNMNEED